MVNVRQRNPQEVRAWAARLIPSLIRQWEALPRIVDEIDHWDDGEALPYIEEWSLHEDQRHSLRGYADARMLTPDQLNQLDYLNQLAEERQSILNHLLEVSETSKR